MLSLSFLTAQKRQQAERVVSRDGRVVLCQKEQMSERMGDTTGFFARHDGRDFAGYWSIASSSIKNIRHTISRFCQTSKRNSRNQKTIKLKGFLPASSAHLAQEEPLLA